MTRVRAAVPEQTRSCAEAARRASTDSGLRREFADPHLTLPAVPPPQDLTLSSMSGARVARTAQGASSAPDEADC